MSPPLTKSNYLISKKHITNECYLLSCSVTQETCQLLSAAVCMAAQLVQVHDIVNMLPSKSPVSATLPAAAAAAALPKFPSLWEG